MPSASPRSARGRRAINDINMVPFIDVMLVLLIIFMVTAPLISPSVIDVPSVGKASTQPDQVIQVLIDAQEKIELKSTGSTSSQISVTLTSLPQQVRQLQGGNANTPVVISADKGIKYETVVKVMDSLQRAGVQRVGLSVQLQP
ncbi:MAG: Biopolymer transport protein ExbD [Pseudomonadota bacterium]|jgi:biopolymer transport protein TolR